MKRSFLFFFLFVSLLIIGLIKVIKYLYFFEQVSFFQEQDNSLITNKDSKKILIINSAHGAIGGAEFYSINLYKNLVKKGNLVKFLVIKNSSLEQKLTELKIDHYSYNKLYLLKTTIQPGLTKAIEKICKENNIQIIHCNVHRETTYAIKAAKKLNAKVVLTKHIPQKINSKFINNIDGIIAVSEQVKQDLEAQVKQENLKTKNIVFIPPIFDDAKFLKFKTSQNRKEFYKSYFNLDIKDLPIICMVANMPKDPEHKNHSLLLKAIHELIYKKNKPVQLVLTGDGESKDNLIKLAKELNISDYIYFLGFTKPIDHIIYHSDINVLTSKKEAFGISLLEAGLLEKPIICATNTGAANTLIIDNQTGLLFENNNLESLVEKIILLLDNPILQKKLGLFAKNHIIKNFSTEKTLLKIDNFYNSTLN